MRTLFSSFLSLLCLAWPAGPSGSPPARKAFHVTVAAGPHDRRETPASFTLPKDLPTDARGKSYVLRDESGRAISVQVDAGRRAAFVLPELRAGATKTFRLEAVNSSEAPRSSVSATTEGGRVRLSNGSREVLTYQGGAGTLPREDIKPIYRRGGYIHPVHTPSGRVVTDDYPPNHVHHHGVWFAWTKTEFEGRRPDFWNMGDGTGTVEAVALERTWSGPVHGGLAARHRYLDLSAPGGPREALRETWEVTAYAAGRGAKPYTVFDLVVAQECAGASPLVLPEYHYGGVGFRGRREWDGKENTFFLTSEGKDRSNGHATRARWCHIGGRLDGELVGIAVLGHPENFRAPQPMRIHPTEPFFNFAPSQGGRWEIVPGRQLVLRYRFVVYDGPPDRAEIERLWNDYAAPPVVSVSAR